MADLFFKMPETNTLNFYFPIFLSENDVFIRFSAIVETFLKSIMCACLGVMILADI